jgi:biotin carboxyl carrier protein
MKVEIALAGKLHTVEFAAVDGHPRWTIDGRVLDADAIEVGQGVYSIRIEGESLEARTEKSPAQVSRVRVIVSGLEFETDVRDPRRWRKHRGGAVEAEGAQQVIAPMPGKIVRVLVKAGDPVTAGQGLAVVEAMKMQNEVKAPKSGKVERVSVAEGQTVGAGDVIAVVA